MILIAAVIWHLWKRKYAAGKKQESALDDEEADLRAYGRPLLWVLLPLTLVRAGCNGLEGCSETGAQATSNLARAERSAALVSLVEPTSTVIDVAWWIAVLL